MKNMDLMLVSAGKKLEKVLFYDGEQTREANIKDLPATLNVALSFSDKELISYNFDLDKDLEGEQLQEAVEIKMFQEAGLNPMVDYKIVFSKTASNIDVTKNHIQAYAASINSLEKYSKDFVERFGFIDLILPTTALPGILYEENMIEKKNDIFLFFTKNSLYISVYMEGNLVYGKFSDDGLDKLYNAFLRNTGEKLKYDNFISSLVRLGLDEANYDQDQVKFIGDFTSLFTMVVRRMENVIQYASRMFMIETFSGIYVGTQYGIIPGLNKFFESSLGIETKSYLFYTDFFTRQDKYIDQRENLLLLHLHKLLKNKKQAVANPFNVSINKSPESFLKRQSGVFLSIIGLIILAFLAVPGYFAAQNIYYSTRITFKLDELKLNKDKYDKFTAEEKELKEQAADLDAKMKRALEQYKKSENLLRSLNDKKNHKIRIALFMNNIFTIMPTYNIKVVYIEYKDKVVAFSLLSSKQENIANFVKELAKKGYQVHMDKINIDQNSYVSIVKVDVR
ncbi:MAG: hypothetical protein ACTTIC_04640 [Helicobacteraceae bacterium]